MSGRLPLPGFGRARGLRRGGGGADPSRPKVWRRAGCAPRLRPGGTAYLKARPSVRRRFNDAVLKAVSIRDRKIARADFSEVFATLFSRPSSNKGLKVDPRGFEPLTFWLPARRSTSGVRGPGKAQSSDPAAACSEPFQPSRGAS